MKNVALTLRVDEARERRDAIDQAWYPILRDCGCRPVLLPNEPLTPAAAAACLRELAIDGVVLTGGNDLGEVPEGAHCAPERDTLESALLEACAAADVPVLGVCRGLQKMVAHYGGTLRKLPGHVVALHPIEVRPGGPLPLSGRNEVNSFHDFGVHEDELGSELVACAAAEDGSVEALAHVSRRQWAIMWHPERAPKDPRDKEIIRSLLSSDSPRGQR